MSTFLSKDPPLVHAGGEEDGRLGDAHQEVGDGQVNDEHVGGRPQAATPAHTRMLHTKRMKSTNERNFASPRSSIFSSMFVIFVSGFCYWDLILCLPF